MTLQEAKNLKAGDYIQTINGKIAKSDDWWYNIGDAETVKLGVWRNGQTIEIEVKIERN